MLVFCPVCANVLVVEEGPNCYRFGCHTCPYIKNIQRKVCTTLVYCFIYTIWINGFCLMFLKLNLTPESHLEFVKQVWITKILKKKVRLSFFVLEQYTSTEVLHQK